MAARKPPKPYDPLAYQTDCDFALAIVKGLVEHDDGGAYFGSLMGYRHHEAVAIARGHAVRGPKTCFDGGREFVLEDTRLTPAGAAVYKELGLDRLPIKPPGMSRAEFWKWDIIFPPPARRR